MFSEFSNSKNRSDIYHYFMNKHGKNNVIKKSGVLGKSLTL